MFFMLSHRFGPLKAISIITFTLAVFALVIFAPSALAADIVPVPDAPAVAAVNLYVAALSALSPIVGYLLNYFLPHTSVQAKGFVQAILAAVVGVLVGAASGADLGLNDVTLLNAGTALVGAVVAQIAYAKSGINTFFGGGLNRQAGDALFQKTPG